MNKTLPMTTFERTKKPTEGEKWRMKMAKYKIIQQGRVFYALDEVGFILEKSFISAEDCEARLRQLLKDKAESKIIKEIEI